MTINLLCVRRTCCFFIFSCFLGCKKNSSVPPEAKALAPLVIGLKHTLPVLLKESSGLCYTDGNLWSFGDSGNSNSIYKIDTTTGAILQIVTMVNYPNVDYEDITADSLYIYVGDTGNNYGDRRDLKILRIKKSDIAPADFQVNVMPDAINFSYPDQTDFTSNTNTNFDCEAMASIGSYLYLFSKDRGDLQTRCYKLPKDTGTYFVSPFISFNTDGKVTDAAYNPITKELALLGYMNKEKDSFIWLFNGFESDTFFSGASKRVTIGSPNTDWQTEGLAYISTSRFMLSCESSSSHIASLYSVQKQ